MRLVESEVEEAAVRSRSISETLPEVTTNVSPEEETDRGGARRGKSQPGRSRQGRTNPHRRQHMALTQ